MKSGAKVVHLFDIRKKIPDLFIFSRGLFHFSAQRGSGIGNRRSYPAYRLNAITVSSSKAFAVRTFGGTSYASQNRLKNHVKSAGGMVFPIAVLSRLHKMDLGVITFIIFHRVIIEVSSRVHRDYIYVSASDMPITSPVATSSEP